MRPELGHTLIDRATISAEGTGAEDPERREAAGVPDDWSSFATKPALATSDDQPPPFDARVCRRARWPAMRSTAPTRSCARHCSSGRGIGYVLGIGGQPAR